MSHIATIKTQLRNPDMIARACQALGYRYEGRGTATVYSVKREGQVISIPGWKFPVVIDQDAVLHYDNYSGNWGSMDKLQALDQQYARQTALAHLRKQGHRVTEQVQENGDIVLIAQVD